MLAEDVDGDGLPDLLQSNIDSEDGAAGFLALYSGLRDGGFGAPRRLLGGALFAAVFDPDGGAAIAAIGYPPAGLDGQIHLLASDGREVGALSPPGGQPLAFVVLDLNADGRPDLAVCEMDAAEAFLNLGEGIFSAATALPSAGCVAIASADLNQDGLPDLAVTVPNFANNPFHIDLTVMIASLDGGFAATTYPSKNNGLGYSCVLQDLNRDELPDISIFGAPGPFVSRNQGGGRFESPVLYSAENNASQVVVADLNGDCWPDVLISAQLGFCSDPPSARAGLYLFLNRGDGTFASPLPIDSGLSRPFGIAAYQAPDASLPSIAVADSCSGQLELLPNLTKP